MNPESKIIRKKFFISRSFQLRMIVQFILIIIIGGILLGLELYIFADNELETKLFQAHMRILRTIDILLPTIVLTLVSVFILVSFITVYLVLYLSHKIAGPLYKFENVTKEIGNGNLKVNIKLRKNDELIRLQNAFESMVENLQNKIQGFKRNFKNIKQLENKLRDALISSTLVKNEKNELISKVEELLSEYEKNINAFIINEIESDTVSDTISCPVYERTGKCPVLSEENFIKEKTSLSEP